MRAPWLTHLVVSAAVFGGGLWSTIDEYGLGDGDGLPDQRLMSWGIYAVPLALAAPLLAVEAVVCRGAWRWVGRLLAGVVSAVLAWIASLPVTLRFCCSDEPVSVTELHMALWSLVVVLVVQTVVLLVAVAGLRWRLGAPSPR